MSNTGRAGDRNDARQHAATLLVHGLTGDSWGIQDVLIEAEALLPAYQLFWETGNLLRFYLDDDARERLVERLRQEIVNWRLVDEGDQ